MSKKRALRESKVSFAGRGPCIDLHTHSNASDGSDSPALIIEKAVAKGIAALALTDHDTTKGLTEAKEAAKVFELEFIGGCELSSSCSDYYPESIRSGCSDSAPQRSPREIHILGLWVPTEDKIFEEKLSALRDGRDERSRKIIAKLNALGFDLSYEELLPIVGYRSLSNSEKIAESTENIACPGEQESQRNGKNFSIGRPHIAELMRLKGFVSSAQQAFTRYLYEGGPAYEPKIELNPIDAVKMLCDAGATVSLAHPMLIKASEAYVDDLVADLRKHGLAAIEAYHSEHSPSDTRKMVDLAAKHSVLLSGGSDYHGRNKPRIYLGSGKNNLHVPLHHLEKLKVMRVMKGLPV